MAQTIMQIFDSHFEDGSWINFSNHDAINQHGVIFKEIDQEADNYVQNLLGYHERWKPIIESDLKEFCNYLEWCKTRHKDNSDWAELSDTKNDCAGVFIYKIRLSLKRYGYEWQKELSPQAKIAMVYLVWPKDDEALNEIREFVINHVGSIDDVELFPDPDASTPEQTAREKLLEEWNHGKRKRILERLEKNGLATKNGDTYNWKIDNDNDYPINLYVYFVYVASEKFQWRRGKDKQRIPWNKFNPIFANMADNQNAMNQYLREIKDSVFPRRAIDIDNLFEW